MLLVLYILLGISVLAPIYTYVLYPFVLKLLPQKKFETKGYYTPTISVIIVNGDDSRGNDRKNEIMNSHLDNVLEIISCHNQNEAIDKLPDLRGEVVIVSDGNSSFLKDTIPVLIAPLVNERVACVSGMSRKTPDNDGCFHDGANWKYENRIKRLESRIGCLSGANPSVFAFKREALKGVISREIHMNFYIPTALEEVGFNVLFEPSSVVYEGEQSEGDLFKKHIEDGASGFRSIARFWKLLLPRYGSFVFWSHRVMKWLVPLNILTLTIGCGILAHQYKWALALFIVQLLFYVYVAVYYAFFTLKGKDIPGPIGKLSGYASYFVVLNVAWFCGLIKAVKNDKRK